jgi:hypothetical protein
MFDVFWFQPGADGEGNWYWGGTFRTKAFAETNVKQKLTVATAMKVGMKVRIIALGPEGATPSHVYSSIEMPSGDDHANKLWEESATSPRPKAKR